MGNTTIAGYVLAGVGLATVAFHKQLAEKISFLANMGGKGIVYAIVGGVALVAVGVVLVMSSGSSKSKVHQAAEEVPIYSGTGKERKIIGYQKGTIK